MEINFHNLDTVDNKNLKFAVIAAEYNNKWLFVRHKDRTTLEIPGGHRKDGEDINVTASRELFEETGSIDFHIEAICDYSVTRDSIPSYGRLFYAQVYKLGELPPLEIAEVISKENLPENLTYKDIQPYLFEKAKEFKNK